jgi:hypothetical protein
VHSTFLRHQQQCSAPLKGVVALHGKGALRLAGGGLDHGTAARHVTSWAAGLCECGCDCKQRGYARTGLSTVEQTAVQLWATWPYPECVREVQQGDGTFGSVVARCQWATAGHTQTQTQTHRQTHRSNTAVCGLTGGSAAGV